MKRFTTYSEIENLCEAMIKDFMKRKHYTNAHCVDIEAFVTEYLGIPIVYETFAEPDPGRIGFLSDGIRPLWVVRGNEKKQVLFPKNTVVLEKYLQTQTEIGRKRFTIAHEGAHFVLSKHIPAQTDAYAAFHSEFDTEMVYSPEMLREILGHVDISTTMNIYVDAMNDLKKKEIAAYSKYITKPEDVDDLTQQDLNMITMRKMGF